MRAVRAPLVLGREEADADGVPAGRRQLDSGGDAAEERIRNLEQDAGAVTRVGIGACGTPVLKVAERLKAAGTSFVIEPHTRFKGEAGEQSTMFFLDPSGNALEFKSFDDLSQLFAK